MIAKRTWFGTAILLGASALLGGAALAQGGPPPDGPGFRHMGGPDDEMRFLGFEGGVGEKKVTGAPFSATYTAQTTQTLADGNKIARNSTGSIARDSEGRVRRDVTLPPGLWSDSDSGTPAHAIFISDPVANVNYILHVEKKSAEKFTPPNDVQRQHHDGKNGPQDRDRDAVTTSLGTQTIGGVQAEGTRITRTIPAGAIGNQNPIQIVIEKWYAPSLQVNVQIKRYDPRFGDTTYQLANIATAEPAATQFQVPSDYAVTAARPRGPRGGAPPPPQQ